MYSYIKLNPTGTVARDHTRVIKLGNGQFIVTIPRELCRWKHVNKGTLLKWQDGGGNRFIVEVIPDIAVK